MASLDGLKSLCKVCKNAYEAKQYEDPAKRKRKLEQVAAYNQTPAGKKTRNDRKKALTATPRGKLMSHIHCALRRFVFKPGSDTPKNQDLFGCTRAEFREHIESQFESWMTWDNYGQNTGEYKKTWQFDHIVPYNAFPTYEGLDEHKHAVCWYKNVQPLCAKKNADKDDAFTQEERDVLIAWHQSSSI
tara:strand:- start:4339 stop:4902 length:564 start_codon:yes stop_codon:yes gene_type:complete